MTAASCGTSLNHAVHLIGVSQEKKAWIVQNSWGTDWGVRVDGTTPPEDQYSNCAELAQSAGCAATLSNGKSMASACAVSCGTGEPQGGYIFLEFGKNSCGIT